MPTTTNPLSQTLNQVVSATGTLAHAGQTALAIYASSITVVEVLSILITVALFVGVIIIIIKTGWFTTRVDRVQHVIMKADMPKKRAEDAWKKMQAHFFAGDDNDLKIAIMEADNLLEEALRFAGVRGNNLGDRLKNLKKSDVPNLDQIWQAHKLRNQIAHEAGFTLRRDLAERTLGIYEEALHNLGVLKEENK
jgi:hypothetical protein